MKKGFFRSFSAAALAAAMTLGMSGAALATTATTGENPASGDGTVTDYVYNVLVSTDLDFDINPLIQEPATGQLVSGSQITVAENFNIVNMSPSIGVKVTYDVNLVVANGATVSETPLGDARFDDAATDKKAYFAAVGAATTTQITATGAEFAYDMDIADTVIPFTDAATPGEFRMQAAFLLDSFSGTALTDPLGEGNVAALTFYGELNTFADWQDDDLSVAGNIILQGVPSEYAAGKTKVGVNQLTGGAAAGVTGFTDSASATSSKNYAVTKSGAADVVVPFNFNGLTATDVTSFTMNAATVQWVKGTDYVINADNITIKGAKLQGLAASGANTLKVVVDGETYTINITLS